MESAHVNNPTQHPFVNAANRTLVRLAIPVLFSLVAEPLTGLADTAFIARLPGSEPVAALGIGTVAFFSIFWAFHFLGVGTQTEVAQALGRNDNTHAIKVASLASVLGAIIGVLLIIGALPFLDSLAMLLGSQGTVTELATEYMYYRLFGAPAGLISLACFGVLRGVQDMRTPFYVAVGINLINILLDWLLIFGYGPIAPMGVAGAAIASSISQWIGAVWCLVAVWHRLGFTWNMRGAGIVKLMKIGGDLFIRTGTVLVFLALCTRVANKAGADEGAAFQALRQFFLLAVLFLDAYAITAQSLVGFFLGSRAISQARRVARLVCIWSAGTGVVMCICMLLGEQAIAWLLVPPSAHNVFEPAWLVLAFMLPLGSLAFATDGIHWGTGDFPYLRNTMLLASAVCGVMIFVIEEMQPAHVLVYIWIAVTLWIWIRAGLGLVRIWPGIGDAPLK